MSSSRRLDHPTLLLLAGMYALLIGNVALYVAAPLPLVFHVLAATLAIHLAFTIWHEAVHQNISSSSRVNEVVGVLGALPYMAPFFVERWFHLEHHRLLNQPDDPNYIYTDGPFWTIPFRYIRIARYAHARLGADPRSRGQRLSDRATTVAAVAVYGVALWQGFLLDVLLLWFVPLVLAKVVMDWYINYLPHAGLPPDRFRGTRIVDVRWFTPLVLAHNYHAVHHLWPAIPWHRYPTTFREKRGYLEERAVPIETRVSTPNPHAHDVVSQDPVSG